MTKTLTVNEFLNNFKSPCISYIIEDREILKEFKIKGDILIEDYFLPWEKIKDEVKHLNTKKKANIYFTPNGHYSSSREKRRRHLYGVQYDYLVIDTDENKSEVPERLKTVCDMLSIEPCFIVETARGYHIYFMLSKPIPQKEEKRYRKIHNYVSTLMGADMKVYELNRLFRLPFFCYWSEELPGEFVTKLTLYSPGLVVDTDELVIKVDAALKMRTDERAVRKQSVDAQRVMGEKLSTKIFDDINKLPIQSIVEMCGYELHNTSIYENGEKTDGWKVNLFENYVHNFTESKSYRPQGGSWAFALKHFHGDRTKTFLFFDEGFGIKRSDYGGAQSSAIVSEDTGEVVDLKAEGIGTFSSGALDATLIIDQKEKRMFFQAMKSCKQISDFYVVPISAIVAEDGTKIRLIRLVGKYDETKSIQFPNDHNSALFARTVRGLGIFNFTGSNQSLNLIVEYINKGVSDHRLFKNTRLGINPRGKFISNNFIMEADENKKVKIIELEDGVGGEEFVQIANQSSEERMIFSAKGEKGDLVEMIPVISQFYRSRVILPFLLTGITGMVSWHLRRWGYYIPYAFLFGLTQSGKTTISKTIQWCIMGDNSNRLSAQTTTILPLQYAMYHNKPVFIGEFRAENKVVQERLYDFLRTLYDGTTVEKGQANLTVKTFELVGTAMIDGENVIEDPAAFSRGIFLHCRREMKGQLAARAKMKNCLPDIYERFWKSGIISPENPDSERDLMNIHTKYCERYADLVEKANISSGESDRVVYNYALISAIGEMIGISEETICEGCEPAMLEQVQRVIRTGSRQKMLWKLMTMAHSAMQDHYLNTITTDQDAAGNYFFSIHTVYIEAVMKISKGRENLSIDSIVESLNGEEGIVAFSGRITIDLQKAELDRYCIDLLYDCLGMKHAMGSCSGADRSVIDLTAKKLNVPINAT